MSARMARTRAAHPAVHPVDAELAATFAELRRTERVRTLTMLVVGASLGVACWAGTVAAVVWLVDR